MRESEINTSCAGAIYRWWLPSLYALVRALARGPVVDRRPGTGSSHAGSSTTSLLLKA
uniref:Uncharacterized protein n=1 Tax=Fagus sylvatica TaxID=28930 RepID=A0A2N9HL84_FAGSY